MACPPRGSFQIGWICALPIELAAAKEMLDEKFGNPDVQDPADSNVYTLGRIGKHHVVIACLSEYGTTSATTVANHMIRTFSESLHIGLMVGVGGAIPSASHDIRLGDIVISCPEGTSGGVLQYDMGKVGTGGEFHRTGFLNSPPRALLAADRFFKPEYDHPKNANECDNCLADWEETRIEREVSDPQPHYGIIASGNAVIKDAKTREQLRLKSGALCFEMEAAGLMMDFPCIVIRGICDYADTHKNKQWQGYAALAAASYAKELLGYVPMGLVSQENLVVNVCKGLKEELESIRHRLDQAYAQEARYHDEQKTRASADQQKKCHQAFKICSYTEQKDINPMKAEGTCQWALQSSEYLRWMASNHNDLLWISADPGCGKSVLSRSIIDGYVHAPSPAVTICYFFFKENEEQNNLATALCSILHQLFSQQPHLLYHAIPHWERNGKMLRKEVDELWRIFVEATSSDGSAKTICIFDALDECREVDQDHLIQNLESFHQQMRQPKQDCQPPKGSQPTQDTSLKFLVTSRPYHHIQNRFRQITGFPYLHLKGEEENNQIHEEIDLVVKMRIKELGKTASLPLDVQQRLEKQLLQMEHRTYLWLHLAIDDIRSTFENSFWPADESIQMIPPSVDTAYEKILSRVPDRQMDTVRKIFRIIVAARRPLTTREMAMALGISIRPASRSPAEAGIDLLHLDKKLRSLCGLFVFVNNSKVYLIHQTAREYLITEALRNPFSLYSCSLQNAEDQMAFTCLRYLMMEELENEKADENSNSADFLEYSAIYWSDHHLLDHVYNTAADQSSVWFPIFWKETVDSEEPVPMLNVAHLAALNGHQKVITQLIAEDRLDPNIADTAGSYPLTYASKNGHHDVARLLIKHGAHVNSQDKFQGNALLAACLAGHDRIVQMLLEYGADANAGDEARGSPLETACLYGRRNIVEALLAHGADANVHEGFHTAFFSVLHEEGTEIGRMLLNHGAYFNSGWENKEINLAMACVAGNDKLLQILLEHGASVSCHLLVRACLTGKVKIVQILLEHGADINSPNGCRVTALEAACYTGNDGVLQLLLEHRAATNACHKLDHTLRLACKIGHANVVQMLLNYGASCINEDKDDATVLQLACSNGHEEIVKILLTHGVDVNTKSGSASYALRLACSNGHGRIVHMLLTHGADIHARGGSAGGNALHAASLAGHKDIVKILLKHGGDVNAQDWNGWSVLMCACLTRHDKIVKILLNHGADVSTHDKEGWTVLKSACSYGYDKIVHILLTHGATFHAEDYQIALQAACLSEYDKIVKTLLYHGAGNSTRGKDGWNVLEFACSHGCDKIVHILLTHGATFHAKDHKEALRAACFSGNNKVVHMLLTHGTALTSADYQEALQAACLSGYNKVVHMLLTHGTALTSKDYQEALWYACQTGHDKIVRTLLKHGARLDAEDYMSNLQSAYSNGYNNVLHILLTHGPAINDASCQKALRTACRNGDHKVVQVLLTYGIDVSSEDCQGTLQLACFNGHDKIVQKLLKHGADFKAGDYQRALRSACFEGRDRILQLLLDHGADVNAEVCQDTLKLACFQGHDPSVQKLLKHGVDFKAGDYQHALQSACFEGRDRILHLLLDHRADIGPEDSQNALRAACWKGKNNVLRSLLIHGIDVNAGYGRGGNALQTACFAGHEDTVQILLEHGADINAQGGIKISALWIARHEGHEKITQMLLEHGGGKDDVFLGFLGFSDMQIAQFLSFCILIFCGYCISLIYQMLTRRS
ncbi:unnamed protein product [Penicillium salamii]|uniref:Nucleoside phosphorylase domain-containing protein n=1 Tax=Penicillium salamii TaxID=1612424 RepID=A0A9W4K2X4_9EURO|nr:unnamed protein product [Penicillium salamii]